MLGGEGVGFQVNLTWKPSQVVVVAEVAKTFSITVAEVAKTFVANLTLA